MRKMQFKVAVDNGGQAIRALGNEERLSVAMGVMHGVPRKCDNGYHLFQRGLSDLLQKDQVKKRSNSEDRAYG